MPEQRHEAEISSTGKETIEAMHSLEVETDRLPETPAVSRAYAWLVFALRFGLLLSDYMSRQASSRSAPPPG
ncbi:hypothetical protein [Sorangium sp. So ce1078]|uniref:hypothetical protein n=1 Tax=Sorangium sp. So ce1078 TaxID=3133329 RepID=UPI003F5E3CEF